MVMEGCHAFEGHFALHGVEANPIWQGRARVMVRATGKLKLRHAPGLTCGIRVRPRARAKARPRARAGNTVR